VTVYDHWVFFSKSSTTLSVNSKCPLFPWGKFSCNVLPCLPLLNEHYSKVLKTNKFSTESIFFLPFSSVFRPIVRPVYFEINCYIYMPIRCTNVFNLPSDFQRRILYVGGLLPMRPGVKQENHSCFAPYSCY